MKEPAPMSKVIENEQSRKTPQASKARDTHNTSAVVSTSKLRELNNTIGAIPKKSQDVQLVATIKVMAEQVERAQKTLEWCLTSERLVSSLLGVESLDAARSAARKSAQEAKKLHGLLAKELSQILSTQANGHLVLINERTTNARTSIRSRWNDFIENRIGDYAQLLEAVRSAKLKGSDRLEQALADLSGAKDHPPSTPREAETAEHKLSAVRKSVEDLNLEGVARDFIVAASQGRGDPRALLNVDVVSFLDAHPSLWKLLRVSLT